MNEITVGLTGTLVFLILIFSGMRIAFAVFLVGTLGLIILRGWTPALSLVGYLPFSLVGTYAYSVIPLFIIMGYFAYYARVSDDMFDTARAWLQHVPGGLAMATVVASAGYGACSGASVAAAGVLARVAIPPLQESGVDNKLAAGVVALGGSLASLIPPSGLIVIFGILAEQPIGQLLIGGILPGILTTFVYLALIYVRVRINPGLSPVSYAVPWKERIRSAGRIWGVLLIVVLVVGGIYSGIFTPTEAAGVGAFVTFVLALGRRKLNFRVLQEGLMETLRTNAMIFAVMIGISVFIRFLAHSGTTKIINDFIVAAPLPPVLILIVMLGSYFILGMVMDALSMLLLTLPIYFPAAMALGFDPIVFCILVVKMCEVCLVTPPVGLNCYVIHSVVPSIPIEDIFKGTMPFVFAELFIVTILIIFPQITLFLPSLMAM
jgi:tripartite ATP-independent transporter DctM subunit